MFLLEDIKIGFRNPFKFINQWQYFPKRYKIRGVFIWLCYYWKRNDCDVWIKYGIRILGIEIVYTNYLT